MRAIHFPLATMQCVLPAPHHGVLQVWQVIRIVVAVVQRTLNKSRIDLTSSELYGFTDHVLSLITRHIGHQKLAPADRFGEPMKARTVPDEVRSYRHNYVQRRPQQLHSRQEKTNKSCGLIATLGNHHWIKATLRPKVRESKQFLELVDEQQHSAAALQFSQHRNQSQCFSESEA